MTFDWEQNKAEALQNGIREETKDSGISSLFGHFGRTPPPTQTTAFMPAQDDVVKDHTFCNFPDLRFEAGIRVSGCTFKNCTVSFSEGTLVIDCTFENCEVSFDQGIVSDCTFKNIRNMSLEKNYMTRSHFHELLYSDNSTDRLIDLTNSTITDCSFDDVLLNEETCYLCGSDDDISNVVGCSFTHIHTCCIHHDHTDFIADSIYTNGCTGLDSMTYLSSEEAERNRKRTEQICDRISELYELMKTGILTQDEVNELKTKLMQAD